LLLVQSTCHFGLCIKSFGRLACHRAANDRTTIFGDLG
jgi:hypothetical protein